MIKRWPEIGYEIECEIDADRGFFEWSAWRIRMPEELRSWDRDPSGVEVGQRMDESPVLSGDINREGCARWRMTQGFIHTCVAAEIMQLGQVMVRVYREAGLLIPGYEGESI